MTSDYCEVLDGQLINDYRYDGDKIVFEGRGVEITSDIGVVACGYQSGLLKNRMKEAQMVFFNRLYLLKEYFTIFFSFLIKTPPIQNQVCYQYQLTCFLALHKKLHSI